MVYKSEPQGVQRLELSTREEHLKRFRATDELGESRGPATARHPPQLDLGEREYRHLICDPDVARQRQLGAGAPSDSCDCRDDRFRQMLEGPEGVLASRNPVLCVLRSQRGPFLHVETDGEVRVARAGEDDGSYRVVLLEFRHEGGEIGNHREAKLVTGWVLEPHDRDVPRRLHVYCGRRGHRASPEDTGPIIVAQRRIPHAFSPSPRYCTIQGEIALERPWYARWPEGVPRSLEYPDIVVGERHH